MRSTTSAAPPVKGDCWPTPEQTLLLQAALCDGDIARRALDAWRAHVDLETLDRGSVRLLPLLGERLARDAPLDPLLATIRGPAERAVAQNGALVTAAADAVRTLRTAGIDSMLLKGMALVARGFMTLGTRPMTDCDLAVPETQALEARDALVRGGWRLEERLDADLLTVRHAVTFRSPSGRQLDLHWHVLAECCGAGADADFWQASTPVALDGEAPRTLCPSDMLLHACVHGVRWSTVPPLRWVPDALAVLRGAGQAMDWERLVDQAQRRILVLPMIDTLRYLRDTFDAPVPAWVDVTLNTVAVPRWAVAEYRIKMRRRSPWRQLVFHWLLHRRQHAADSLLRTIVRVPSYVRHRWRVPAFAAKSNRT